MQARSRTWPDRASPNAAIAARRGMSRVESGPEILCHRPALASVGRASRLLELADALLQRPEVELLRIDLGERQLFGPNPVQAGHFRNPANHVHGRIVDPHAGQLPGAISRLRSVARGRCAG